MDDDPYPIPSYPDTIVIPFRMPWRTAPVAPARPAAEPPREQPYGFGWSAAPPAHRSEHSTPPNPVVRWLPPEPRSIVAEVPGQPALVISGISGGELTLYRRGGGTVQALASFTMDFDGSLRGPDGTFLGQVFADDTADLHPDWLRSIGAIAPPMEQSAERMMSDLASGFDIAVMDTPEQEEPGRLRPPPSGSDSSTFSSLPDAGFAQSPVIPIADHTRLPKAAQNQAAAEQKRLQTNIEQLASVIRSEAEGENLAARTAVGFVILNRMKRNQARSVSELWTHNRFMHNKPPRREDLDLSRKILTSQIADNSEGATHFYTPGIMPGASPEYARQHPNLVEIVPGQEQIDAEGKPALTRVPSWAVAPGFTQVTIPDVEEHRFKFYRQTGDDYVR